MKKNLLLLFFTVAVVFGFTAVSHAALFGFGETKNKTYTNSIGIEFVLIPAGSFQQATSRNEFNEILYREVTIEPFYLSKYEVTQEQWVAMMGNNPASNKGRTNPVEDVSWGDVQTFIAYLDLKERHIRYRLPTEAEWEYAARGGTDTQFFFMKDPKTWEKATWEEAAKHLADYAWFDRNSGFTTHPVGQKKPNPYGLYDVYGNVSEWVQDREGSKCVYRGGGWAFSAEYCRSASRIADSTPDYRSSRIGFRLALSPE